MADVTIRLRHNPTTGKREIVISYESEADALPHEHERDHRALVEALIGRSVGADAGDIVVERVVKGADAGEPEPAAEVQPAGGRRAEKQGG